MSPLPDGGNLLENQSFPHADALPSSAGRSDTTAPDTELVALVTAWATLPDHLKAAVRALLGIAPPLAEKQLDDSLPPGFEKAKGGGG